MSWNRLPPEPVEDPKWLLTTKHVLTIAGLVVAAGLGLAGLVLGHPAFAVGALELAILVVLVRNLWGIRDFTPGLNEEYRLDRASAWGLLLFLFAVALLFTGDWESRHASSARASQPAGTPLILLSATLLPTSLATETGTAQPISTLPSPTRTLSPTSTTLPTATASSTPAGTATPTGTPTSTPTATQTATFTPFPTFTRRIVTRVPTRRPALVPTRAPTLAPTSASTP